jgi:signal transduction histidine kinase
VIKHAQPARTQVRLSYSPSELVVEGVDDGERPPRSLGRGRGIAGMRERVALYAGELTVGERSTGGFGVQARFPIEDA